MNRSEVPLVRKLGIKQGFKICVIDPPVSYWRVLGELPQDVSVRELSEKPFDLIHAFVTHRSQLEERLGDLRSHITPNGMIWVSWPKRSSKRPADLTENVIRDLALRNGLVDTKVCAVDDVWSALKLVIRLKDRPNA